MTIHTKNHTVTAGVSCAPSAAIPNFTTCDMHLTWSRRTTPSTSRRKAIVAAVIAIAIWAGWDLLVMTDIEDHKPTITLIGQP